MSGARTFLLGVALSSAGVTGVVVRYALFPLTIPASILGRAALVGVLAAAVMVGFRTVRQARRAGGTAPPARVALALLGPALLVAGVGLAFAPRDAAPGMVTRPIEGLAGEIELADTVVPGLGIALPPWSRTHEVLDPIDGRIELADPYGRDRHMKVEWKLSEMPPDTFFEQVFVARGLELDDRRTVTVAGSPTERLYFADDVAGKRVAVTYWRCPDDPRTFSLLSFLVLERDDLLRLHDRVLASVRCTGAPADLTPVFPHLDAPDLERLEQLTGLGYATAEGEVYFFTPGTPDLGMTTAFLADAELRRTIVRGMELTPAPDAFAGPPETVDGGRLVFSGRVTDPEAGTTFTMLMTAFTCGDRAFIGLVFPADTTPSPQALHRLGQARCP